MDKEKLDALIKSLQADAKPFVDEMLNDPYKATKYNYGKVMSFLSSLAKTNSLSAKLFLVAMTREGYPKHTASQISSFMGW